MDDLIDVIYTWSNAQGVKLCKIKQHDIHLYIKFYKDKTHNIVVT